MFLQAHNWPVHIMINNTLQLANQSMSYIGYKHKSMAPGQI